MKFEFKNRTGGYQVLPEGDYQVEITDVETKISTGAATAGSDMWALQCRTESGAELEDQLIFHPKCDWKVDAVLRAIGRAPSGPAEIELSPETFKEGKATVHVVVETYEKKSDQKGAPTGKGNKIVAWITPKNAKTTAKPDDF